MRETDPALPETIEAALRRLKQLQRARYATTPGTSDRAEAERAEERLARRVWTLASKTHLSEGD